MSKERIWFETIDGSVIDNYDIAKLIFISAGVHIEPDNHEAIKSFAKGCRGIKKEYSKRNENVCACCGETIPEGRLLCWTCDCINTMLFHRDHVKYGFNGLGGK
jgi:hypothetical protein